MLSTGSRGHMPVTDLKRHGGGSEEDRRGRGGCSKQDWIADCAVIMASFHKYSSLIDNVCTSWSTIRSPHCTFGDYKTTFIKCASSGS
eukprot:7079797-Pyramimonas_sp.AAC.1